jgi:hypothetical protein
LIEDPSWRDTSLEIRRSYALSNVGVDRCAVPSQELTAICGSRIRKGDVVKVAIVGGRIGGMALAVKELGVGINVLLHAVRELTELGLLDELCDVGIPTAEWVLYSKHGQLIWGEPRGLPGC